MNFDNTLMHYGTPRHSGRYPWGSGGNPYQHSKDFIGRIEELQKQGFSEREIAKTLGILDEKGNPSTTRLRAQKSYATDVRRLEQIETVKRLRDKEGLNNSEIGKRMGINESTVRSLLNPNSEARTKKAMQTADFLREQIKEKKMIDVGSGVEIELGISQQKLNEALYILEGEGYPIYKGGIPQVTNVGKQINQRVLCAPGTEHKEIYEYDKVKTINEYASHDGGETFDKFVYPKSMDSKRLQVRYVEDGGIDKDGIVELRRGVSDLSLGDSHYAQVRILVDNKKYIKGMAVYSDDMPDGVDVIFNTNKTKDKGKLDVLKDIKNDPDNPFGSLIKPGGQSYYIDKNGKKQLSLINKRADEGDWTDWADALPSQFLGKQSSSLINKQLDITKKERVDEYNKLCELTNPTIKKHLLNKFADECDSAAVHLKAAALPGQKYHVIIPVNTLKDTEVYAPQYENGSKLALVRYPHGGLFEIPILTVNNRHEPAKKLIGTDTIDAICINKTIADRLSGADFDGDTVMAIPTGNGKVKISNQKPLKDLEGFDPKMEYPERSGMKYMSKKSTQTQMGVISNLITDMTLGGAKPEELARAVKHSMVVIDAEKHKLDYKRSEVENDIASLKKKYQISVDANGNTKYGGASTILSRAKSEVSVDKRQGTPKVNIKGSPDYDPSKPEGSLIYKTADPDTLYKVKYSDSKTTGLRTYTTVDGKKIKVDPKDKTAMDKYRPIKKTDPETGDVTFTNKKGDIVYAMEKRKQPSTRMAETNNAYDLVSSLKHPKELAYADYANTMKALANQSRKEAMATGKIAYSKTARDTYKKEVASLNDKLKNALLNSTKERAAQRKSNYEVEQYKKSNPDATTGDIKKKSQQSLTNARDSVGSVSRRNRNIEITDREWEAIQAGAVSENILKKILDNTDTDALRQRATPRSTTTNISQAKINKIKAMKASGKSLAEIAAATGVSTSTVSNYLKGA